MRLIDLSQPVYDNCPHYPGDPPVRSQIVLTHQRDGWLCERLTLSSHTGSHVDAPLHRIAGAASLDDIPLDRWVGHAFIADLRDSHPDQPITAHRLESRLPRNLPDTIILLATGWGDKPAHTDEWLRHAPLLSLDGAEWLVDRRVRGAGIDYLSVGDGHVHEILLRAGIWIVEGLHFPPAVFQLPQPVQFWSLPINLKGHSGAFCRPVVVVD